MAETPPIEQRQYQRAELPPAAAELKRQWDERLAAARERADRSTLLDRTTAFRQRLQERYPDYATYWAYHILIGSSLTPERAARVTNMDFPGEDSILTFLDSLE